jgi:hypothetical protein
MPKLTAQASEFFSGKKEVKVVAKKDEVMLGTPEIIEMPTPVVMTERNPLGKMIIDSPKHLWDGVGHIQFELHPSSWEDAMDLVSQTVGFWSVVADDFKELFEVANKATPAQLNLLKRLFGDKYTDDFANLTKEEASAKIDEQMKATGSGGSSAPAPAKSGGYDWKAKKSPAPAAPAAPAGNAEVATDKQLGFAQTIAKRKKVNLPDDYKLWNKQEASDWIKANTA